MQTEDPYLGILGLGWGSKFGPHFREKESLMGLYPLGLSFRVKQETKGQTDREQREQNDHHRPMLYAGCRTLAVMLEKHPKSIPLALPMSD